MSTNIITTTKTNISGVELVYLAEIDAAGIHCQGLARLLGCDARTVANAIEGVNLERIVEAQIQTAGGIQGVKFILEQGVVEVLEKIQDSNRTKKETRDAAKKVYRQFAIAGFKLYTMLQVAPVELKSMVDAAQPQLEIPKNFAEALRAYADQVEANELQRIQLEQQQEDLERQAEVIDELFDYSSIIRIAKYNKCDEKAFSWRSLKAASKAVGKETKKVPCPRFGEKNLYSHDAWRLAYPGYRLPETTTLVINAPQYQTELPV